jgi:hypothetical protein
VRVSRRKRKLILAAAAVVVYVAAYTVLSIRGGYVQVASGATRLSYGFAVSDMFVWQPSPGVGYHFRDASGHDEWMGDLLGWLFRPLIEMDQRFVHRSVAESDTHQGRSLPGRLHPSR